MTTVSNPLTKPRATCLSLVLLSLAGCPGRLEDPDRFVGNNPGDGSVTSCTIGVSNVEGQLLRARCATANCHDRAVHAGGLDMASPGLVDRQLNAQAMGCPGRVLVVPGAGEGYLLDKLRTPQCGARMPLGSQAFTASEILCVQSWMMSLRADAGAPMDVPVDAPTDRVVADAPRDVPRDAPVDARADGSLDARVDGALDASDDVTDVADVAPDDAPDLDAAVDAPDVSDAPDVVDVPRDTGPRDTGPRDTGADAVDAPDVFDAVDVGEGPDAPDA